MNYSYFGGVKGFNKWMDVNAASTCDADVRHIPSFFFLSYYCAFFLLISYDLFAICLVSRRAFSLNRCLVAFALE